MGQVDGLRALAEETNSARADRLASQEVLGVESTEELIAHLAAVTPADLQRVARDYLAPERGAGVYLGRSIADKILAARRDDGSSAIGSYAHQKKIGYWTPTAPLFKDALLPEWG